MGGVRSFFTESKFFQLVVEEGGQFFSLKIFERSRYFMKLVFMGSVRSIFILSRKVI